MLAVAVAAITSCTKSEVVDIPESRLIGFDPFVGKQTRADETTTGEDGTNRYVITGRNDLKKFWVYGTMDYSGVVFDGQEVAWVSSNAGGHYAYEPHKTWSVNKTYRFAAISDGNNLCSNVTYTTTADKNELTISDYIVGNKDLIADIAHPIFTKADGSGIPAGRVSFALNHLLTRVRFELENTSAANSGLAIKITDLKFTGVKKATCTYDLNESNNSDNIEWTPASSGATADYTYPVLDQKLEPGGTTVYDNFVIPQGNDLTVTFTVETYAKDSNGSYLLTNTTTYNPTLKFGNGVGDYSWHPGKVYNYLIKIGGSAEYIHFDATVDGWDFDLNGNGDGGTDDDVVINTQGGTTQSGDDNE